MIMHQQIIFFTNYTKIFIPAFFTVIYFLGAFITFKIFNEFILKLIFFLQYNLKKPI